MTLLLLSRPRPLPTSLPSPPPHSKPNRSNANSRRFSLPLVSPSFPILPNSLGIGHNNRHRRRTLPLKPLAAWQPPKYEYPDPIPEFAAAETEKFRDELWKRLSNSREAGLGDDNIGTVVDVCAEILSEFLHKEYGGPGTLLIEPFTDMLLALKEKKLPGATVAARAAILWAQNNVDKDWEAWNSLPTPNPHH